MIKTMSTNIARGLGSQLQSEQDDIEVYAYGLEILLGALIKVVILIILSVVFDILPYTLLIIITFAGFRSFGGGVHAHTYARCLTIGIILLLGLAKIASILTLSGAAVWLGLLLSGLLAVITIICWVPAGTDKKVFTRPEVIRANKIKTTVFLVIWMTAALLLLHHSYFNLVWALVLGAMASLFFITPWGYFIMDKLENILAGGKEVQA